MAFIVTNEILTQHRWQSSVQVTPADTSGIVSNANIVGVLPPGPLRDVFDVSGLSVFQANQRVFAACAIRITPNSFGAPQPWAFAVGVDGSGRPIVSVSTTATSNAAQLEIEFLHSITR